jgi:hypothetical protein
MSKLEYEQPSSLYNLSLPVLASPIPYIGYALLMFSSETDFAALYLSSRQRRVKVLVVKCRRKVVLATANWTLPQIQNEELLSDDAAAKNETLADDLGGVDDEEASQDAAVELPVGKSE